MGIPSGSDSNCKKHPNLKQLPGVCSSCLREKLAKLSRAGGTDFSSAVFYHHSSVSSSPRFSSMKGGGAHPARNRKKGSESFAGGAPLGFFAHTGASAVEMGGGLLKKSRSMTCDPTIERWNRRNDEKEGLVPGVMGLDFVDGEKRRSGSGFWKKLITSTSRKTKGVLMMHSKTIEEESYY